MKRITSQYYFTFLHKTIHRFHRPKLHDLSTHQSLILEGIVNTTHEKPERPEVLEAKL